MYLTVKRVVLVLARTFYVSKKIDKDPSSTWIKYAGSLVFTSGHTGFQDS